MTVLAKEQELTLFSFLTEGPSNLFEDKLEKQEIQIVEKKTKTEGEITGTKKVDLDDMSFDYGRIEIEEVSSFWSSYYFEYKEFNSNRLLEETPTRTDLEEQEKQEIQLVKTSDSTEECMNNEVDEVEEEAFNASEVGKQPYECGAIVSFVSRKGKKEEILTGVVYGHGWNAGTPDIKGPADNILIRTEDKKSHVTPKRLILEIITPAPKVA